MKQTLRDMKELEIETLDKKQILTFNGQILEKIFYIYFKIIAK